MVIACGPRVAAADVCGLLPAAERTLRAKGIIARSPPLAAPPPSGRYSGRDRERGDRERDRDRERGERERNRSRSRSPPPSRRSRESKRERRDGSRERSSRRDIKMEIKSERMDD